MTFLSFADEITKLKTARHQLHENGRSLGSSDTSKKYASVYLDLQKIYKNAIQSNQIDPKDYNKLKNNTFIDNVCSGTDLKKQLSDYLSYAKKELAQAKHNPENWNDKKTQIFQNDINRIEPEVKHDIYPQLEYKYQVDKNKVRIIPSHVLPVDASDVNGLLTRGIDNMTTVHQAVTKRYAKIPKVGGQADQKSSQSNSVVYTTSPLVGKSRKQNSRVAEQNRQAKIRRHYAQINQKQSNHSKHGIFNKVVKYFSKPYSSNANANAKTGFNRPNQNNRPSRPMPTRAPRNPSYAQQPSPQQAYLQSSRQKSMMFAQSASASRASAEAKAQAIQRARANQSSASANSSSMQDKDARRLQIARANSVSVSESIQNKKASAAKASVASSASASASTSTSIVKSKSAKKASEARAKSANAETEFDKKVKAHAKELRRLAKSSNKSSSSSTSTSSKASSASSSASITGIDLQNSIIANAKQFTSLSVLNSYTAQNKVDSYSSETSSMASYAKSASVSASFAVQDEQQKASNQMRVRKLNDSATLSVSLQSQASKLTSSASTAQSSLSSSATLALVKLSSKDSASNNSNIAKILTNAHAMAVKSAKDVKAHMVAQNRITKSSQASSFATSASVQIQSAKQSYQSVNDSNLDSQATSFLSTINSKRSQYSSLTNTNASLASTVNSYKNQMSRINALIGKS